MAPSHGFTGNLRVAGIAPRPGTRLISTALRSNEERCQDLDEIRSDTFVTNCAAQMVFDGTTGEVAEWQAVPQSLENLPTGNTVTFWVRTLHFGQMLGPAYQVFVSLAGLAIGLVAATGVYIWWKKRGFRAYAEAMTGRARSASDV